MRAEAGARGLSADFLINVKTQDCQAGRLCGGVSLGRKSGAEEASLDPGASPQEASSEERV